MCSDFGSIRSKISYSLCGILPEYVLVKHVLCLEIISTVLNSFVVFHMKFLCV